MTLKAVIFDLDGTLGDTLPVVVQAMQDTFLRFTGQSYSPPEIYAMFGPSEEGVFAPRVDPPRYEAALKHYFDRYAELHAFADQPFPGVIDLLERIQELGLHTGVVTGKGPGTARISVAAMGLGPYIERLEAGSAAGADKPAALRLLLDEWNLQPHEAAYVGDMPYDMTAARAVGLIPLGAAWAATTTVDLTSGADQLFFTVEALLDWVISQAAAPPPAQTPPAPAR